MNRYNFIINPNTNLKTNINSKLGKNILNNYIQHYLSGGHNEKCSLNIDTKRCKKSGQSGDEFCENVQGRCRLIKNKNTEKKTSTKQNKTSTNVTTEKAIKLEDSSRLSVQCKEVNVENYPNLAQSAIKKYHTSKRKSPPFKANDCPNVEMIGNDKNKWKSLPDKSGKIYRWKKIND